MKNLAIVPARSGSQRLRHKNIKLLAGHPLIYYQINCAKKTKGIDKVVVATDSKEYAAIAESFGAEVIIRPPEISGSKSKTEDTLLFVIDQLEKKGEIFDNVILLQPTNALNKPEFLKKGLEAIKNKEIKSVLTYSKCKRFFLDDDDIINRPMSTDKKTRKMETGCFWITNIEALKKEKNRIVKPYVEIEVPEINGLDIDTLEEMNIMESILIKQVREKEGKYFKKREYDGDFEAYYGPKKDPDGKIRDISKEKDLKIEFCKDEIKFINNLYDDRKERKILDIGCGAGFVMSAIDDNKWEKFGLEVSRKAAETAKKYIPNIHIGVIETDTYPEEFFDLVYSNHVIEHVLDPIDFIRKINKIMKTHGHLIIATPNFDSGAARRFGENFRLLHDKTHISLFSDFSLKQLLEDNGFIVDKIEYPFLNTEYFTKENLMRLFDTSKISPPFYGSVMTLYARKK